MKNACQNEPWSQTYSISHSIGCIYTAGLYDQFWFCDYIRFFEQYAYISFKSDPQPMCAFYTALGETSQK